MFERNSTNLGIKSLFIVQVLFLPFFSFGQSNNYWTRSFNEESSLLSGAVVGGGSGPSAIYYNPASISEVKASKLSVNASLFSFDFIKIQNALGDDININSIRANIEPRFLSYMIKSRRYKNWSFEIAILNNKNITTQNTVAVDQQINILTGIPGDERYFAFYEYSYHFRDDWIGAGGSVRLSDKLFLGVSMFVTIKTLKYSNILSMEAYSLNDTIFNDDFPFYSASSMQSEFLTFNDYRLIWKVGLLYHAESFSIGLNVTTPSLGGIYSDGKRVMRKAKQENITNPESGEPVSDYVVVDYKEKKDVQVSYRTPLSIAAGFTYYSPGRKRTFYSSIEFFSGINPYRIVEANESQDIGIGPVTYEAFFSDWLSFVSGARPVLNIAQGYSVMLNKSLQLMGGFRTDFNYIKNFDFGELTDLNKMYSVDVNLYHISCGLSWKFLGQDLITGISYTLGRNKNQQQIANLSDPVEYNPVDNTALQGTRTNDMTSLINSISIYFGASFNFGEEKK